MSRRTISRCLPTPSSIGFDYGLRDELAALAERKGCVDLLSRTEFVQRGLVPDWPSPAHVVAAIERELGEELSQPQRRNLEILFAHDQLTVETVLERRAAIPFDVGRPPRVLRAFVALQERRDPGADDAVLLLAVALEGADQVEITNNRRRWLRSRRRGRSWLEIHLTDEAVAGGATRPYRRSIGIWSTRRSVARAVRAARLRAPRTPAPRPAGDARRVPSGRARRARPHELFFDAPDGYYLRVA